MKNIHIGRLIICSSLALWAMGCGPQPKPEELTQLEALRMSEESAAINQAAPEAFRISTTLTQRSVEAWQRGELAQARTFASLGQRQYATAQAEATRIESEARQVAAEAEINTLTQQMETLRARQDGLEKSIALMKTNISTADMANVEHRIQMALTERERAVGVEGDVLQREVFLAAEAKLAEARDRSAHGRREEAGRAAEEARLLYVQVFEAAQPIFAQKLDSARSAQRQRQLFEEAQAIVGPSYVLTDMRSTRVIFAGSFDRDRVVILPSKLDAFRRLAEMARKYEDATIVIEGFTQTRTSQFFEVSQRRADAVRDFLISQGIAHNRIITTARGRDSIRYNENVTANRGLNDRVEISLTLP
ncbi:MAG: OmpA family protein [Proteobacteria bacterium]|nr:OmpA family protein [Pseudomonadota bacterium]